MILTNRSVHVSPNRRYYKNQDSLITQFEDHHLGVDDAMENTEEQTQINKIARRLSKASFLVNLVRIKIRLPIYISSMIENILYFMNTCMMQHYYS